MSTTYSPQNLPSKCPKCGTRMHVAMTVSRNSTLMESAGHNSTVVEGVSCHNCGKWLEIETEIVQTYRPTHLFTKESRDILSIKLGVKKLSVYDHAVWACRKKLRKTNTEQEMEFEIDKVISATRGLPKQRKRIANSISRLQSGRLEKLIGAYNASENNDR